MKEVLLISQAVRGNRKALEKLVRLYYEKIYNYIGYRVQDFSAAEDLTQDVFVKLTRHIHSYVPTASFSAFLYRIAHNTVVDYYRTTKHTETIPETLQADDPLPAAEALSPKSSLFHPNGSQYIVPHLCQSHNYQRPQKPYNGPTKSYGQLPQQVFPARMPSPQQE